MLFLTVSGREVIQSAVSCCRKRFDSSGGTAVTGNWACKNVHGTNRCSEPSKREEVCR